MYSGVFCLGALLFFTINRFCCRYLSFGTTAAFHEPRLPKAVEGYRTPKRKRLRTEVRTSEGFGVRLSPAAFLRILCAFKYPASLRLFRFWFIERSTLFPFHRLDPSLRLQITTPIAETRHLFAVLQWPASALVQHLRSSKLGFVPFQAGEQVGEGR